MDAQKTNNGRKPKKAEIIGIWGEASVQTELQRTDVANKVFQTSNRQYVRVVALSVCEVQDFFNYSCKTCSIQRDIFYFI